MAVDADTTRVVVTELAAKVGVTPRFTALTVNDVLDADEVFLTNSIMGVMAPASAPRPAGSEPKGLPLAGRFIRSGLARAFGPALVSGEWGGADVFLLVYVVGPVVGALVAAFLYFQIFIAPGKSGTVTSTAVTPAGGAANAANSGRVGQSEPDAPDLALVDEPARRKLDRDRKQDRRHDQEADAFGEQGNPQLNIGNKDTVLVVVDLVSGVLEEPAGAESDAAEARTPLAQRVRSCTGSSRIPSGHAATTRHTPTAPRRTWWR